MAKVTMHTPRPAGAARPSIEDQRKAMSNNDILGEAGGNIEVTAAEEDEANVRRVGPIVIRTLDEAIGKYEVIDKLGRTLIVQRLSELEAFDLIECYGSETPNAYTVGRASIAACVRSVVTEDGRRINRTFPRHKEHIRGAIALLSEAGMDAARAAISAPPKEAVEDDGSVTEDKSVLAAKN